MKTPLLIIGTLVFLTGLFLFLHERGYILKEGDRVEEDIIDQENISENEGLEDATIVIEPIDDIADIPTPSLVRDLGELTASTRGYLEATEERIRTNPQDIGAWIEIGAIWRSAGDYEGAEEAWQYALLLNPDNPLTLVNLGNLYYRNRADFITAESFYLGAITKAPLRIDTYFQITDLYLNGLKDREKALSLLEEGRKILPTDEDIEELYNSVKNL